MEFSIGWVLSLIRRARLREITEELWEEYLTARLDVLLPQGNRVELRDCGTEYFGVVDRSLDKSIEDRIRVH